MANNHGRDSMGGVLFKDLVAQGVQGVGRHGAQLTLGPLPSPRVQGPLSSASVGQEQWPPAQWQPMSVASSAKRPCTDAQPHASRTSAVGGGGEGGQMAAGAGFMGRRPRDSISTTPGTAPFSLRLHMDGFSSPVDPTPACLLGSDATAEALCRSAAEPQGSGIRRTGLSELLRPQAVLRDTPSLQLGVASGVLTPIEAGPEEATTAMCHSPSTLGTGSLDRLQDDGQREAKRARTQTETAENYP